MTWNLPVNILIPVLSASMLTGIRTSSGRLIMAYYDSAMVRYTSSDDNGLNWSPPVGLVATSSRALQLSQTSDGKLWLAWNPVIGVQNRYVTSSDNGSTWSAVQLLPTPVKYDMCFVSGQGGSVHCIYASSTGQADIQRITSTDGGTTWSAAIPIVNTGVAEKRPRIARQSNGTIWLLYDFTRVDSLPMPYSRSEIKYVTSTDGGTTWGSPNAFTRYVGNNFMHNVTIVNDKPFVTFASDRWIIVMNHLWYGIIGETPDDILPPIFLSGYPFHSYSGLENWIKAYVDDEAGIAAVIADYFVDGAHYPPLQLFDDGMHFDGRPGDNIWGNTVPSFPPGWIDCFFRITDITGNTINVYGFGSLSTAPPPTTHVTQGSSMQVAFDRFATFGRYVLPANYPGFGLRYPVGSVIEHVFAGAIWVGGKIDTTAGGSGQRIKAVSTGFEGWSGPYYEFFPGSSPADTIWRVYGRNAPKPSGWDQYWGNALPFRPVGDENFFNQYNDYTQPVAGHVPMGLKVIQSSYTWNDQQANGIQILEFKIMNNSVRSIDSAYVAFFMDGDVGPLDVVNYGTRNYSGYYGALRTAYIHNPVDYGSTPLGVSVLGTPGPLDSLRFTFQWYPGVQSPAPDGPKYDLMSSGIIKPDEFPSLSDTRFLLSFGPFTIQPHTSVNPDTLRTAFALLSAADLSQLQQHATRARDIYQVISGVEQVSPSFPVEFALHQNFPNPFNPATTIRYDLRADTRVSLKVFNILGQEVLTLVNEEQKAGYKSVEWNASNFASGVYFYRLQAGPYTGTKKLLLLR